MNGQEQLALNLCLRDYITFENYYVTKNSVVVKFLKEFVTAKDWQFAYLWGGGGVGKTHLLMACCNYYADQKIPTLYVPLAEHKNLQTAILDDIDGLELICLDDLDAIIGNREWEEAVFHCYNKIHVGAKKLLVTANAAPQTLSYTLHDLKSRMMSNMIFKLEAMTDDEIIKALIARAKIRGIDLSMNVAKFLLHHYSRDTENLFEVLDVLDKASLREKCRITLPFVKKIIK